MEGKRKFGIRRVLAFLLAFALLATSLDLSVVSVSAADVRAGQNEGAFEKWIDRVDLPQYAKDFYVNLDRDTGTNGNHVLLNGSKITIGSAEGVANPYIGFSVGDYMVEPNQIDESSDRDLEIRNNLLIAYKAFLKDHPEIFWLTDTPEFGLVSRGQQPGGTWQYMYYLILSYVDPLTNPYTVYTEGYEQPKTRQDETAELDRIINGINVSGAYEVDKVKAIHDWLITANFSQTAAGTSQLAGKAISAIKQLTGDDAPSADAYAQAMKVICEKKGFPCVLVNDGNGKSWNYVKVGSGWYLVDIAADKANTTDVTAPEKISTKYLLLGSKTQIDGGEVSTVYTPNNLIEGVSFSNGPVLSASRYPLQPEVIEGVLVVPPTLGSGTAADPYQIGSESELFWFRMLVNGNLTDQAQDADACAVLTADIALTAKWTPIGTNAAPFAGTFDGNGFTVSGMRVEAAVDDYAGFFGKADGAEIKHFGLTGASVSNIAGAKKGALCGELAGTSTITNCFAQMSTPGTTAGIAHTVSAGSSITYSFTNAYKLAEQADPASTFTNSYFVASGNANQLGQSAPLAFFTSGQITYQLNGDKSTGDLIWRQNVDNSWPKDEWPQFKTEGHAIVYKHQTQARYSNKKFGEVRVENTNYTYNDHSGGLSVALPDDWEGGRTISYQYANWNSNSPGSAPTGGWTNVTSGVLNDTTFPCRSYSAGVNPSYDYWLKIKVTGSTNYNDIEQNVAFRVNRKPLTSSDITIKVIKPANGEAYYTGNALKIPDDIEIEVTDGSQTLVVEKDWFYTIFATGETYIEAKEYDIQIMGQGNYSGTGIAKFLVKRKQADVRILDTYQVNYTYGDTVKEPTDAQIVYTGDAGATKTIKWYNANDTDRKNPLTGIPSDAGAYIVRVEMSATGNYEMAFAEKTVTIAKKTPTVDDVTVERVDNWNLISEFDGKERVATVTAKNGLNARIGYRTRRGSTYLASPPKNAGEYELWVIVEEATNFAATQFKVYDFTIQRKSLSQSMFNALVDEYYSATPREPAVSISGDGSFACLTENDFTVTYRNNTNVGSATAVITGKNNGNFTGQISLPFRINPKIWAGDVKDYYEIRGDKVPTPDGLSGDNWYKGAVTLLPANGYTIWLGKAGNATTGDGSKIEIKSEGIDQEFTFYLKDADGYIVFVPNSGTPNYREEKVTLSIDAQGPVFNNTRTGGITISGENGKRSPYRVDPGTTKKTTFSTVDNQEVSVRIEAYDKLIGLDKIYYFVDKVSSSTLDEVIESELELKDPTVLESNPDWFTEAPSLEEGTYAGFTINGEGKYVVYAYATDKFGNKSSYICSAGITIDKTPPEIGFIISPTKVQGTLKDTSATISYFNATEKGTFYFKVLPREEAAPSVDDIIAAGEAGEDGTAGKGEMKAGGGNTFEMTDLTPNTEYRLYIAAVDRAGNQIVTPKTIDFKTCKIITKFKGDGLPTLEGEYGTKVKEMTLTPPELADDMAPDAGGTWAVYTHYVDENDNTPIISSGEGETIYPVDDEDAPAKPDLVAVFTPDNQDLYETLWVTIKPRVNKKKITVQVEDAKKVYDTANPAFTWSLAGEDKLVGTDTPDVLGIVLDFVLTANNGTEDNPHVGTYDITGTSNSKNYEVEFLPGTLTVTKAQATITVNRENYRVTFGDAVFPLEDIEKYGESELIYRITKSQAYNPQMGDGLYNGEVITVDAQGNVRIDGAGEADIQVSMAASKNYFAAVGDKQIHVSVAKHAPVAIDQVEQKYVYAAGTKDQPATIELSQFLLKDIGKSIFEIPENGIVDTEDILAMIQNPETEEPDEGGDDQNPDQGGNENPDESETPEVPEENQTRDGEEQTPGGDDQNPGGSGDDTQTPGGDDQNPGGSNAEAKAFVGHRSGNLFYQVKKLGEDMIGTYADITVNIISANYEPLTVNIHILIRDKIQPFEDKEAEVDVVDKSELTYGVLLGDVALNTETARFVEEGSDNEVKGTLVWKEPETVLQVGNAQAVWLFTPDDTETYKLLEGTLYFTVNKAVPIVQTPTASPSQIIYNPTTHLSGISVNGSNGTWTVGGTETTVRGTWGWKEPDTVPTVDKPTYTAVFTPKDTDNYDPAEIETEISVSKAVPYIAANPDTSELTYGDTLSNVEFTGGSVQYNQNSNIPGFDTPVPGVFAWIDGSIKPQVPDSKKTLYDIEFIPEDEINYESVGFMMPVTVNPAEKPDNTPAYDHQDVPLEVEYISQIDLPENWEWDEKEDWALKSGMEYHLTAIYKGEDAGVGNFKIERVSITVRRAGCVHPNREERNVKSTTCFEDGYSGDIYCSVCGEVISAGTIVASPGHQWDAGVVTLEPTCEEDGTALFTCTVCHTTEERVNDPRVEKRGHDWEEELTMLDPTCTEEGATFIRCKRCDAAMPGTEIKIPSFGGHIGGTATCTQEAVCERCGERYGEVDPANHPETEVRGVREVSCSQEGYTGDTFCLVCENLVAAGSVIEKLPHRWMERRCITQPDCVHPGLEVLICGNCGIEQEEVIEATGVHKWSNVYTIDRPVQGSTDGSKSFHCTICDSINPESVVVITAAGGTVKQPTGDYKVVTPGTSKTPSVEYTKPADKNAQKVNIPAAITVNGISYQVTSVAANAFKNNKKITQVTIGNNVTKIGNGAFSGCTKLQTVTIGNKVKTVGNNAFDGCKKLKNVTIGSKVTSIGTKAFNKCTELTKITIPKNVSKIGKQAFNGCAKLKNITIKTTKLKSSNVGSSAFKGTASKAVVKVPKSKLSAYKKLLKSKGMSKKATYKKA